MSKAISPDAVVTTPKVSKSVTNWSFFDKMRLFPKRLECRGYKPNHPYDSSCHSKLRLRADSLLRHTEAEHGGGFRMTLQVQPEGAKLWSGWEDLGMLGVELKHFRCAACHHDVQLTPQDLQFHMARHINANKRSADDKQFEMTLVVPRVRPEVAPEEE